MDRMGVGMGFMDLDQELARADVESVSSDNTVASGTNGNVQVVVRVRPPSTREREQGYVKCVGVDPQAHSVSLNFRPQARTFTFDYVSDEAVGQEEIFTAVGKPITDACLQGYHCCLIAYGQTGAGKTFTMEGPDSESSSGGSPGFLAKANLKRHEKRGLIPRILDYIFQKMASEKTQNCKDVEFVVKCSYLQIYNEQVSDLLDPGSYNLTIHEDAKAGMYVEGLQEVVVSTAEATYGVFRRGSENRHVGMTAMNLESSRSHSVFTVVVESQRRNDGGVMNRRTSRFYLVDLAGSERQKHSESAGIRLKEAGSINKSLSALGNVIKALVDISEGKIRHVPYRDSKLTFLLKDALGGNSKCTLIANVSPAEKNMDETLSTLKFAQRAKLIHNTAIVNEDMFGNPAVMGEEIRRLRLEIAALRANMGSGVDQSPMGVQENLSESARTSRLEHIISQSVKRSLEAERKTEMDMHVLSVKLGATQAMCERLEKTLQSQKMIIRLRENTIKRIENGRPNLLPDELVQDLREEIEQLRKQIEHHPDVVRFKMELDLCRGQLEEYEEERKDEELLSQIAQLENLNQTLKTEFQEMVDEKTIFAKELEEAKNSRDFGMNQLTTFEEQFVMLREAVEKYRMESAEALHKQEKAEEKLQDCTKEQDEVWRRCNLAEAQATEYAQELTALKSQSEKMKVAFGQQTKLQEDIFMELQKATDELEHSKGRIASLSTQLEESSATTAHTVAQLNRAEEERAKASQSLEEMVVSCEQLTSSLKDKEAAHGELHEQVSALSLFKTKVEEARAAEVVEKEALTKALSQLTVEKDLSFERLEKLRTDMDLEVSQTSSTLQSKLAELEDLRKLTNQQAIAIAEKEKFCKAAEEEVNGLRHQLELEKAEQGDLRKMSSELESATTEATSLLQDKTKLEFKVLELEQTLSALSAIKDDKGEAEKRLLETSAMLTDSKGNVEALTADHDSRKAVIGESESKLLEVIASFSAMKEKYEALVVNNQSAQTELSKKASELEAVSHQKSTLDSCLSEELLRTAAAEKRVEELTERISKLQEDLAVMEHLLEKTREVEILEQRTADQKCNILDESTRGIGQEDLKEVLTTDSRHHDENLSSQKIADVEVASAAMKELIHTLEEEKNAFQLTIHALQEEKQSSKTEEAALKVLLHSKEEALQTSASQMEDLKSTLQVKGEELQRAEGKILDQMHQLEEARNAYLAFEQSYSQKVKATQSLKCENEVLIKNISDMEGTLRAMEESIVLLKQEKAALQSHLEDSEKNLKLQHPTEEEVKDVDVSNHVDRGETRVCIDQGRNHIDHVVCQNGNAVDVDVGLKKRYSDEKEDERRSHEQETDARLVAALSDVVDLKGQVAGCETKLDLALKSQVEAQEQALIAVSRTKDLEGQVALLTDDCSKLKEAVSLEICKNRSLESNLDFCKGLEPEYAQLKLQAVELGKELESTQISLEDATMALERTNSEKTPLLERIADLNSAKELVLQELEELKASKSLVETQLSSTVAELVEMGCKFRDLDNELQLLRIDLENAEADALANDRKLEIQREEVDLTSSKLAQANGRLSEECGRVSRLERTRVDLETEVKFVVAEKAALAENLQKVEEELFAAVNEFKQLSNDLEQQFEILKVEKDGLAEQLHCGVSDLERSRSELDRQIRSLVAEKMALVDNLQCLREEFPAAAIEFGQLRDALEQQFEVLKDEKEGLAEEFHLRVSQLDKLGLQLKGEMESLEAEKMAIAGNLLTVEEELVAVRLESQQSKSEFNCQLEAVKVEKDTLLEHLHSRENEHAKMREEMQALTQKCIAHEDQFAVLQTCNTELCETIDSLNCEISDLDTHFRSTVTDNEAELSALAQQVHEKESQLSELKGQNVRFASDLQELRDEVQYNLGEVEYEFQKHIIDTEARMVELESQKKLVQSEALQLTTRLSGENSKFAAMLGTLEVKVVDHHRKVKTWVGNFNNLETELLLLKDETLKMEGLDARIKELEMELLAEQKSGSEYKQEILQLRSRLAEQVKRSNPFSWNSSTMTSSKNDTRSLQSGGAVSSFKEDFSPKFSAQQRKTIATSSKERQSGKSKTSYANQNSLSSFRALSKSLPTSEGNVVQTVAQSQSRLRNASVNGLYKSVDKPKQKSMSAAKSAAQPRQPLQSISNVSTAEMNRSLLDEQLRRLYTHVESHSKKGRQISQ